MACMIIGAILGLCIVFSFVPQSTAQTKSDMQPYREVLSDTDAGLEMVPIAGGHFTMGSPADEPDRAASEGPQFEVQIEPFWVGKYEVTWQQYDLWAAGMERELRKPDGSGDAERHRLADAIARPSRPYTDMTFGMGKSGCPAICMTQLAAKTYCQWLSAKTGRYYRLPTEAEWEYACRAGSTTAYSFGDDPKRLDDYAWYFDNAEDRYQKVGRKKPNAWGLYDMHGNVSEWVLDAYTPDGYPPTDKLVKNPLTVPIALYPRVVRGGSWFDDPEMLRSAARTGSSKQWKSKDKADPPSIWYHTDADFIGFRVVRPLRIPTAEESARYGLDQVQIDSMAEFMNARASK